MNTFEKQYEIYLQTFEAALYQLCGEMAYEPALLTESMRYSLLAGGKRIRPVLFFAALAPPTTNNSARGTPSLRATPCSLSPLTSFSARARGGKGTSERRANFPVPRARRG